jgi:hypothetical protein
MKNRKNLGCRIKGTKERGAWAELYFMALAMSQGLKVSSPYGGFASYDVGVEDAGPILRVQVKCTMCRHPKGGYSLSIWGPKYRGYPPGTVDFFALYVIPTDDWYIIPYAVIGEKNTTLHFTPDGERQKHGRYQEAGIYCWRRRKGEAGRDLIFAPLPIPAMQRMSAANGKILGQRGVVPE